jgi:hypothetical protein
MARGRAGDFEGIACPAHSIEHRIRLVAPTNIVRRAFIPLGLVIIVSLRALRRPLSKTHGEYLGNAQGQLFPIIWHRQRPGKIGVTGFNIRSIDLECD